MTINVSSVPISQRHRNHGPAYDDLTKQKLVAADSEHVHGELVEDHLEDLVKCVWQF